MSVNNLEVKLISECFVKPKYNVEESKKPHHLIATDLKLLSTHYFTLGILYNKPTTKEFEINSFVDKMKDSLSHALVHYYPLAGRFTTVLYEDEGACSVHVDCIKGPGARFIHAACEQASVSDIVHSLPRIPSLFDLGEPRAVNYDGHTQALLTLQVTEVENGIALAFTMNHSIGDGVAFLNFITSLSEIFRSKNRDAKDILLSRPPIFTHYLPDGCSLMQKLPYLKPNDFINRVDKDDDRLEQRIFHFSTSSIVKLKERAKSELGPAGLKISSFQAFAALVWFSINRARKTPAEEMTTCFIPIDCRARLRPPLPLNHFSNQAHQALLMAKNVGELLQNGLGSASLEIHNRLARVDDQVVTRDLKALMEKPKLLMRPIEPNNKYKPINLVTFLWGPKFDVYGVDFEIGKAVASLSGAAGNVDGKVILMQGAEGEGSIDLTLHLFRDDMIGLESDKDFMAYVS